MFNNRDPLFSKKDNPQKDSRTNTSNSLSTSPRNGLAPVSPSTQLSTAPVIEEVTPVSITESKGSKLIVGPDIKLKGVEITDCDTLVVEGRVEASMDSRVIQIAERGIYNGTVGIDVAEIHGRFEGELTARKQLVIHATGKVSGKIRYGKITVAEGGELSGDVQTISASNGSEKSGLHGSTYDGLGAKNKSIGIGTH
jgi:cytoskeletal protein CcmA (bactofilin family)